MKSKFTITTEKRVVPHSKRKISELIIGEWVSDDCYLKHFISIGNTTPKIKKMTKEIVKFLNNRK
jgi:hypothetical protein